MKKCNNCGKQCESDANFCSQCGGKDFGLPTDFGSILGEYFDEKAVNTAANATAQSRNSATPAQKPANQPTSPNKNGNIASGIFGAFLFSFIGVAFYAVLHWLNAIAGITSIVMYIAATAGYAKFAKIPRGSSKLEPIVAIAVTAVMIFVSEYLCTLIQYFVQLIGGGLGFVTTLSYAIDEANYSIGDDYFVHNLFFGYLFALVALLSRLFNHAKAKRRTKAAQKKQS